MYQAKVRFETVVEAAAEVADYAARYGITTMVENHGFFVNGSDRIIRLVECRIVKDVLQKRERGKDLFGGAPV